MRHHVYLSGLGDHLDARHYRDDRETAALGHRDWLTSGSDFGYAQFTARLDAIATGMLAPI